MVLLFVGLLLIVAAYVLAFVAVPTMAAVLMIPGLALLQAGFGVIALRRHAQAGRSRSAAILAASALALPVLIGFAVALQAPEGRRVLGFPTGTGVMLLLVGVVPLVVLPLLHAWLYRVEPGAAGSDASGPDVPA